MNRSCPRITLQDLKDKRFAGAPASWIRCLDRLKNERLLDEASVGTWLPAGEILSGVIAKRARAAWPGSISPLLAAAPDAAVLLPFSATQSAERILLNNRTRHVHEPE